MSASMTPAREWPSFGRIVDIPFDTCVAALDSWQRTAPDREPRMGGSRLRGPIKHDGAENRVQIALLVQDAATSGPHHPR